MGFVDFLKFYNIIGFKSEKLDYNNCIYLKQTIDGNIENKFVDRKCTNKIRKILRKNKNKNKNYCLVCQENMLFLMFNHDLFVFLDDFSEYRFNYENYCLINQEKEKNNFLNLTYYDLQWIYPVSPGRFENLIRDLLEYETANIRVRNCGNVNDSDGGKDIIFYKWKHDEKNQRNTQILVLGQCKAYQKTVNKNHVIDIRDRLDENQANGFFLAVTEKVSSPLINSLLKLRESGYDVDWWTKDEIFSQLQSKPNLLTKYNDIIKKS